MNATASDTTLQARRVGDAMHRGVFTCDRDTPLLELARTMIALGEDRGCPTVALLTAMDRPLGRACGNALETEEAILALRGELQTILASIAARQLPDQLLSALTLQRLDTVCGTAQEFGLNLYVTVERE